MAQFDILLNKSKSGKQKTPYLLDIQSDSISILNTRIVVPVRKSDDFGEMMIKRIHISFQIDNVQYIAFISEMAAVPANIPGKKVANIDCMRTEIISAIDFLFTGF